MVSISVAQLMAEAAPELQLTQVAGGEGSLGRGINHSRIQKPGLVLVGHGEGIHAERLAVFGNTEMTYAAKAKPQILERAVRILDAGRVSALILTKDNAVPPAMREEADRLHFPILATPLLSSAFILRVGTYLEDALSPSTSLHAVLIDVLGVGILILGKSGIGKSEAALDLVLRGHRLVADDIVDIKRRGSNLFGQGSEIIKHHMEIRGLGIINIKDLFGVAAVRERKKIEMVVELVEWDPSVEYDRLGVEEHAFEILDLTVPQLMIPVRPGRNMTTIIEVAARNHLLKLQGHHSALAFQERLNRAIAEAGLARRQLPGEDVE